MYHLKRLLFSIAFFVLIFATTYLSMHDFADQPSATCMDCSYLKDVFFFSIFSLFLFHFVLFIMNKAKINKTPFSLIISAIFILLIFINNFNLFKDRVSSWSSYSFKDEVIATILQSYPYVMTGGIIVSAIFYSFYKIDQKR